MRHRAAPAAARHLQRRRRAPAALRRSGSDYTVKRGDTLSKIAKEYKPENVSLEQMLVAMFRSNEGAFDGKNMNRLRTRADPRHPAEPIRSAAITPADARRS